MKAYFIRLFNYDRHANRLITEKIIEAGNVNKAIQIMAHLLAAQQIWLSRCRGEATNGSALRPGWPPASFDEIIDQNHTSWLQFLDSLDDHDFQRRIKYKSLKGDPFENNLSDILAHVINHGTHHRAQAGQQLKFAGLDQLPVTDYIFYVRNEN
jgi:uncharacterized damage-inducible protein DinB